MRVEADSMPWWKADIHEQLQRLGIPVVNSGSNDYSCHGESTCFERPCFYWFLGRSWDSR